MPGWPPLGGQSALLAQAWTARELQVEQKQSELVHGPAVQCGDVAVRVALCGVVVNASVVAISARWSSGSGGQSKPVAPKSWPPVALQITPYRFRPMARGSHIGRSSLAQWAMLSCET